MLDSADDADLCPLSSDEAMELWLGPGEGGSLFHSREELRAAWLQGRAYMMQQWGCHGRRPAAFYEFEWEGNRPDYDREQSTLYDAGVLSEAERAELVTFWRKEFERGYRLSGAAAQREHFEWADIPRSLLRQWRAEHRRRAKTVRRLEADVGGPPQEGAPAA